MKPHIPLTSILYITVILLLSNCKAYQYDYSDDPNYIDESTEKGMPSKPGSCFAKCLIQDKVDLECEEYTVFTGDYSENVDLKTIHAETQSAGTKWVRKKYLKNFKSSNPSDSLAWCLTELPRLSREIIVLKNTTQLIKKPR